MFPVCFNKILTTLLLGAQLLLLTQHLLELAKTWLIWINSMLQPSPIQLTETSSVSAFYKWVLILSWLIVGSDTNWPLNPLQRIFGWFSTALLALSLLLLLILLMLQILSSTEKLLQSILLCPIISSKSSDTCLFNGLTLWLLLLLSFSIIPMVSWLMLTLWRDIILVLLAHKISS